MNSIPQQRPAPTDYPPGFQGYVERVPELDVMAVLSAQVGEFERAFGSVAENAAGFRYADGKWSVRQIVGHLADSERIIGYRAVCFARGEASSLPGFEEDDYVRNASFDSVPLAALIREWRLVRESQLLFFEHLAPEAWERGGIANDKRATVRAMAYVLAGHVRHHAVVFEERYRPGLDPRG